MVQENPNQNRVLLDDQTGTEAKARNTALGWLIVYGAYELFVQLLYTILSLLRPFLFQQDTQSLGAVYRMVNELVSIGSIALIIAILSRVHNRLCRIIFGILLLLKIISLLASLFFSGKLL